MTRPTGYSRDAVFKAFRSAPPGLVYFHLNKFVEWRQYTNPTSKKTGWISDGGEVRYEDPRKSDPAAVIKAPEATHAATIQKAIADDPASLPAIRTATTRVKEAVYGMMYRVTPHILSILPEVLDTKEDFSKIGFNPALSGVAGHRIHDPVSDATGIISTHVAIAIASRVIAKGITWARKRSQVHKHDDAGLEQAAEWLTELYRRVGYSLGIDFGVTKEQVLTALATRVHVDKPKPVNADLALAGQDGKELARLMAKSKELAEGTLTRIVRTAIESYSGKGKLLGKDALKELGNTLAAIRGSAELLGRSRIRERVERIGFDSADESLSTFKEGDPSVLASPEEAVRYFTGLVPKLGIDPERWVLEQRRRAFTLAASANTSLTERVQSIIAEGLKSNRATSDITADLSRSLNEAGVGSRNPQYSEMVVRTNINDCFQTGQWEEAQQDDVKDLFPVWQYLGINDHRAGLDHRPRFNKYYPRTATFADVRGDRPYNCRCSLRWVDIYQWSELQAKGVQVESSWPAIVA